MARPSKLNEETQRRLLAAISAGNTRRASALYGGVDERTLYGWIKRGQGKSERENNGEYFQFFQALTRAEAECEVNFVAVIKKAAAGYDTGEVRTKTKSYTETVNGSDGKPLIGKDGTPVTKTVTETETVTTTAREFDWRAALEWLKRRKRADWGDSLDLSKLDDETIVRLLQNNGDDGTGQ